VYERICKSLGGSIGGVKSLSWDFLDFLELNTGVLSLVLVQLLVEFFTLETLGELNEDFLADLAELGGCSGVLSRLDLTTSLGLLLQRNSQVSSFILKLTIF